MCTNDEGKQILSWKMSMEKIQKLLDHLLQTDCFEILYCIIVHVCSSSLRYVIIVMPQSGFNYWKSRSLVRPAETEQSHLLSFSVLHWINHHYTGIRNRHLCIINKMLSFIAYNQCSSLISYQSQISMLKTASIVHCKSFLF